LVLHVHEANQDWLVNTGKLSHWNRITAPYLQSQGINRIAKIVFCRALSRQAEILEQAKGSFAIAETASASGSPIQIKLGEFRVLILPEIDEAIVNGLPNERIDVVCYGRVRSRHIPRDSLIAKLAPSVVISSGTKMEIVADSKRDNAGAHFLHLKQDGAITAERSGDDLLVHTFLGTEFRLTSRSR